MDSKGLTVLCFLWHSVSANIGFVPQSFCFVQNVLLRPTSPSARFLCSCMAVSVSMSSGLGLDLRLDSWCGCLKGNSEEAALLWAVKGVGGRGCHMILFGFKSKFSFKVEQQKDVLLFKGLRSASNLSVVTYLHTKVPLWIWSQVEKNFLGLTLLNRRWAQRW